MGGGDPDFRTCRRKDRTFVDPIHHFRKVCANEGLSALLQEIITETGYVEELKVEGTDEAQARIENIDELITKVVFL